MKLNDILLSAWMLFYPAAIAAAQNETGQDPGIQRGLGLVVGLALIGLAFALARRKDRN